jgi:hypothetical protein
MILKKFGSSKLNCQKIGYAIDTKTSYQKAEKPLKDYIR